MTKRLIDFTRLLAIALVLSISTEAQTESTQSKNSFITTSEFGFSRLTEQRRPARRAGFSLMSSSPATNVSGASFSITPMAVAANFAVLGSGMIGRLTKTQISIFQA